MVWGAFPTAPLPWWWPTGIIIAVHFSLSSFAVAMTTGIAAIYGETLTPETAKVLVEQLGASPSVKDRLRRLGLAAVPLVGMGISAASAARYLDRVGVAVLTYFERKHPGQMRSIPK